jgi:hypothetical protein
MNQSLIFGLGLWSLAIGVSAQSLHQRRTMFDRGEGLCGLKGDHY